MRKVLILVLCVITTSFAWANNGVSDSIDNTKKKQIEDRVNSMYRHVFSEYLKSKDDLPTTNFDSLYYSQDFYHLHSMIGSIENQLGEPIIHDADFWVCGQDWCDDLSAQVLNVEMVSVIKALVTINIHNCNDHKLTLVVVYERQNWFIDDIKGETSVRQRIIQELESYKKEGMNPASSDPVALISNSKCKHTYFEIRYPSFHNINKRA